MSLNCDNEALLDRAIRLLQQVNDYGTRFEQGTIWSSAVDQLLEDVKNAKGNATDSAGGVSTAE